MNNRASGKRGLMTINHGVVEHWRLVVLIYGYRERLYSTHGSVEHASIMFAFKRKPGT